jgi:hypothetical protein
VAIQLIIIDNLNVLKCLLFQELFLFKGASVVFSPDQGYHGSMPIKSVIFVQKITAGAVQALNNG